MADLVVHTSTKKQLANFMQLPSHGVLITGPTGSGKMAIANQMASQLLNIDAPLEQYPYRLLIAPVQGKAIGIAPIRELEHFLSLKVPNNQKINRIVLIEDSHLLTIEAQNALLKTLEEPPIGTSIIMTASYVHSLLPTVRSRVQQITIKRPSPAQLSEHFSEQGNDKATIMQASSISGGMAGLMHAMLTDSEHPMLIATKRARLLLSQSMYERLNAIDELTKNKSLAIDTLIILQQMAHISLQTAQAPANDRWQRILSASYDAQSQLGHNAQPKLTLTNLMLNL